MKAKMKLVPALLACVALSLIFGCSTRKKEIERLHGLNYKYPEELAKDCALHFPNKDSVGAPVITHQKADNINYQDKIDSLQYEADKLTWELTKAESTTGNDSLKIKVTRLTKQISDLKKAYRPCKPDTVNIKIPHYIENTAALEVCQNNYDGLRDSLTIVKTKLAGSEKDNSSKIKYLLILGGVVLVLGGLWLYKLFKR